MVWSLPLLNVEARQQFEMASKLAWSRLLVSKPISGSLLAAAVVLTLTSAEAAASGCRTETFRENSYTVCSFDPRDSDLRVFWRGNDGAPLRTFSALADEIASQDRNLVFAMNGGMYQEDLSPVGLLIIDGTELKRANTANVSGEIVPNFYKKPNGVFFIGDGEVGILETELFLDTRPAANFATQSGPLLVVDGDIHPAFIAGSAFRKQRNGVGVSSPTEAHFVLSQGSVNFYDFAQFFRDHLRSDNALFLDGGSAPGIYAPDLGRNDPPGHGGYGPIIGVLRQNP